MLLVPELDLGVQMTGRIANWLVDVHNFLIEKTGTDPRERL